MNNLIKIVAKNGNELYLSILRNLLTSEFLTKRFNGINSLEELMRKKSFNFSIVFIKHDFDSDTAFERNGHLYI